MKTRTHTARQVEGVGAKLIHGRERALSCGIAKERGCFLRPGPFLRNGGEEDRSRIDVTGRGASVLVSRYAPPDHAAELLIGTRNRALIFCERKEFEEMRPPYVIRGRKGYGEVCRFA